MSFNKRYISNTSLLEKYHNSGFQETVDWVTKPDALFIQGQTDGVASQFVRLLNDGKLDAAEELLNSSAKELIYLQGQLQSLMSSFGRTKDNNTKDFLLERIQEIEVKIKKISMRYKYNKSTTKWKS